MVGFDVGDGVCMSWLLTSPELFTLADPDFVTLDAAQFCADEESCGLS